jgi:adenylate cyclase
MKRKLTAILCADVYGYSRLMGQDDEATLQTLTSHRRLIGSSIERHRGRFVNSAGDSVLAEFASVIDAVNCAVDIQTSLKTENTKLPTERRMEFRIGVNLGDVMVESEQIYGDGVNVAARLESLAEPGGICISGAVHDQVRDKLALVYENVGEQVVKNIPRPVHAWRLRLDGAPGARGTSLQIERGHWRGGVRSLAGLAIIIGAIVLVQQVALKPTRISHSIPPRQQPAPAPDRPSIAVLPFTNMSGDRNQEYFSDGITDDLITDLARLPGLFVIARESAFTYKGKPAKLQDVGRELGVKYVLGGSVRKAAEQVRITVQLADATTGAELWAERYDRPLRDVFALQDEIVRRIVTTLNLQLALSQQGVMIPRSTENLEAYDCLLRGTYLLSSTKNGNAKARQMFEKAIELDHDYAYAYASLGLNYFLGWVLALDPDPNGLEWALHMAQRAVALDDSLPWAHGVLAHIYVQKLENDRALTEAQRAIALDPNYAFGYSALAEALNDQGKPAEALAAVEKAMRLDPRNAVNYLHEQGWAYTQLGRWEEAIPALKSYLVSNPDYLWGHAFLAIDYYNLGDHDAARAETAQVERVIALAPSSAIGYLALAFTLSEQGKPVEALAAAEKGTRLFPRSHQLAFERGVQYLVLGRWEESLAALKICAAVAPNDIWVHALLAEDYAALGQTDAARAEAAEVEQLFELDPNSAVGYQPLAVTLLAQGKEAEGLAALEKGMRLDPGNRVRYLWSRGGAYTQLGRWKEAASDLKAFLARYPDQVRPHVELALNYIELGQDEAARAEVAEALRLDPQFSLDTGVKSLFPMDKEHVAADLRMAGLN